MGKRGFSVTTWVLVTILVGALYMVGRTVTPPPPGPPTPPPVAKPAADPIAKNAPAKGLTPAQRAEYMKKMEIEERKKHGVPEKSVAVSKHPVKKFNPDTIEIAPAWNKADGRMPGHAGVVEMSEKVAAAREQLALERKRRASMPGGGTAPATGGATPNSGAQPAK